VEGKNQKKKKKSKLAPEFFLSSPSEQLLKEEKV